MKQRTRFQKVELKKAKYWAFYVYYISFMFTSYNI